MLLLVGCQRTDINERAKIIFGDSRQLQLINVLARGNFSRADYILKTLPIDLPGTNGGTVLWWEACEKNFDGFEYLLRKGADPNKLVSDEKNTMEYCAEASDPRFLESILKYGGKVNLVGSFSGETPIAVAVMASNEANIEFLLRNGAELNFSDTQGDTPLSLSLLANHFDLAVFLLKRGADPNKRNKAGLNAFDFLERWKRTPDHPLYPSYTNAVKAFEQRKNQGK